MIATKESRIAELAKQMPNEALRMLVLIDVDLLGEAFRRTREVRDRGLEGQMTAAYAMNLDANLDSLLHRFKSGNYRVCSEDSLAGIPAIEDEILQRALAMVLGAVYEQDSRSLGRCFGTRRSLMDAISELRHGLTEMGGGWVLELHVEGLFESLDHSVMQDLLRIRIADEEILRPISEWLDHAVVDGGLDPSLPLETPPRDLISPLLTNLCRHHVFDVWFHEQVRPRLRGRHHLVCYADEIVIAFESERVARRVVEVLPKRLEKCGLTLQPDKPLFDLYPLSVTTPAVHSGSGPRKLASLTSEHELLVESWYESSDPPRTAAEG